MSVIRHALAKMLRLPPAAAPCPRRASISELVLRPAPIDPRDVIAGEPYAEVGELLRSADDCFSSVLWRCTPGTFRWRYRSDEMIHILEGEARVQSDAGGAPLELRTGDVFLFPIDTSAVWQIMKTITKVAFFRSNPGDPLGRLRAKLTRP
jgi:uncharacterized cupin superfamily protein